MINDPISTRSILMLSTHQCVGLPSGLFPTGFPTITYTRYFPAPFVPTHPSHPTRLDNSNYTLRRLQIMQLLVMQISPPGSLSR
jgi:hypothetical protein